MNSNCSIALLESALEGNLPAEDETSLHRHLEECEECNAALERMAGGPEWCREAASLLAPDELDEALPTREEWSEADFVVEHLEPADEPHVLGRLGGYDVLEIIGHGGMGVVLKGYDRELKRCVAIKVLAPHLARSSLAKKRFAREAQAAAAIVHPNVLAIHQVQPTGRLPFLVMPLVAGESLAERLTAQGSLELKEVLRIGMQAAAGLAAAHEQGLVHRDVKPANILLEKGIERAVLTDFGLARAADDVALTRWGIIAGTPEYMSPEQARGEPLDGRSDLFSLGCVLYQMATGVSPFRADSTLATMRRLVDDQPTAMASLNPELPPWFIAVVDRLLEKEPSQRFDSAKEVSELLEGCLAHVQQPGAVSLPVSPSRHDASRRGKRSFHRTGLIAMYGALGLTLLGLVLWQTETPEESNAEMSHMDVAQTGSRSLVGTHPYFVRSDPGSLGAFRGQTGESLHFRVTGSTKGTVWGSDVYTDDSSLATAAVHAGVLESGQTGVVKVTILPGRDSYSRSTRNGVMTHEFGSYSGSFWVQRVPQEARPPVDVKVSAAGSPITMDHRGQNGRAFFFRVTGSTVGSVWGSDVYTDDSSLATAAVHAGVLENGQTGIVKVTILPGRDSYAGSTRHGVTTSSWESNPGGSFRVERATQESRDGKPSAPSAMNVQPDPGSVAAMRGRPLCFHVTGSTAGAVWGSDFYTDDSSLAAAAVHAGVLRNGETGIVKVTLLPGHVSYAGSIRHGVTTREFGPYPRSFRVERVSKDKEMTAQRPNVWSDPGSLAGFRGQDPGSLTAFRGQVGKSLQFRVTGRATGSVWGSDVYTDDSSLATAAVHAGVLADGQTGIVKVTILPGRDSYAASNRHGMTTGEYGPFPGSFWVERAPQELQDGKPSAANAMNVQPDPGSVAALRRQPLYFRVTGNTEGAVWGSDVYTEDSTIATAAVHAGALRNGETGIVKVTLHPIQASYAGSTRNGVTTHEYGANRGGSYRVERISQDDAPAPENVAPANGQAFPR